MSKNVTVWHSDSSVSWTNPFTSWVHCIFYCKRSMSDSLVLTTTLTTISIPSPLIAYLKYLQASYKLAFVRPVCQPKLSHHKFHQFCCHVVSLIEKKLGIFLEWMIQTYTNFSFRFLPINYCHLLLKPIIHKFSFNK